MAQIIFYSSILKQNKVDFMKYSLPQDGFQSFEKNKV